MPLARGAKSAAVTGAILDRWNTLGATGSMLGFPTRDEAKTPDGVGRFSEFEGGSVYWSPATGAWEVPAGIMQKWAQAGYEQGRLGYPVGAPQADGVYRMTQQFQHGTLTGYDARIVLLGYLLQLSPQELDEAYNTLLQAFVRDGKDPAQGFVDTTNHAIDSYNTTRKLATADDTRSRVAIGAGVDPISTLGFVSPFVPRVLPNAHFTHCKMSDDPAERRGYGNPGTPRTKAGDVFFSVAAWHTYVNHGHAGIFIEGYRELPEEKGKSGTKTVEAISPEKGVQVTDPHTRPGVCRPILMHVKADDGVKARAVDFAKEKAAEKAGYNINFFNTRQGGLDRKSYNCSQLVWAAYQKASGGKTDIGLSVWSMRDPYAVYPIDILQSFWTTEYDRQNFDKGPSGL
ncbi:hypothetical protein J7S19_06855 [Corynebacterium pyruviciproducens]|nr:hypothetical protein [Corynebacterium pyruviciproducens]